MFRLILQIALGVCVVLSAVGCQQAVYTDYAAFVREPRPTVPGLTYRVGVPDVIVVTHVVRGERVETRSTIDPSGRVWVEGFEPVWAVGLTPEEIARSLDEQATESSQDSAILVRVETFASQKIFVFGQVDQEGPQAYHGANTVLDAVASAGLTARADANHVQVLRPSADGEFRRRLTVDLNALIQGGDSTLNVVLSNGDVVFVPPTGLGALGLALDQVFGKPTKQSNEVKPAEETRTIAIETAGVPQQIDHDFEAMRETLSQLTHQLEELQTSQAEFIEATRTLAATQPHQHTFAQNNASPTLPVEEVVFTTSSDDPRGGAGESPRREGVQFWGP